MCVMACGLVGRLWRLWWGIESTVAPGVGLMTHGGAWLWGLRTLRRRTRPKTLCGNALAALTHSGEDVNIRAITPGMGSTGR